MVGMYDLIVAFVNHTPSNDIEQLVYIIVACASYVIVLISVPYIFTVISNVFKR